MMGDGVWQGNYEDAEESDEETWTDQPSPTDGLIFLIDCTESMLEVGEPGGDRMTPFGFCLKCCKTVQQNKAISSDKDLVGVVLFRTRESSSSEMKNIVILQPLDLPDVKRILQLEKLMEISKEDFEKEYGLNSTFSLYEALWSCQNMFNSCTRKLGYKRILLFTDDDDPHRGSPHLQRQATIKAKDFQETDIDLEILPIKTAGRDFDMSAFYQELLFVDDEEYVRMPDPAQRFEELLTRIRSKEHRKRAQARVGLELCPGVNLQVGVYNLVLPSHPTQPVLLDRTTNETVIPRTRRYLTDTAELLLPQDIKKALVVGGRKICFEQDEIKQMKAMSPIGIKLLGFKSASHLRRHEHIRPSQFLYPDERSVEGSGVLFTALLRRCLERQLVAICRYVPRRGAVPALVALLPQMEKKDETGVQTAPPGFHVIFLPFSDDYRKLELPKKAKATPDQVDRAKAVVQALKVNYEPDSISNPHLQRRYANIEALALDRVAPDEVPDHTVISPDVVRKRAGKALDEFLKVTGLEKRLQGVAGGDMKRFKPSPAPQAIDPEELRRMAEGDGLQKLTVLMLKDAIKAAKIRCKSATSKKADLIEAILTHFGITQ